MLRRSPIDYREVARALSEAVQAATGLSNSSVVMAEAEDPAAPRLALPYCTYKITTASMMFGDDSIYPARDADGQPVFYYAGPRSLGVSFDFYGQTHLQAYELGTLLQMGLSQDDANNPLQDRNMAVWRCGDVVDLSIVLGTGFEGRSHLDCMFGMTAIGDATLKSTQSVGVAGVVTDDSLQQHTLNFTPEGTGT